MSKSIHFYKEVLSLFSNDVNVKVVSYMDYFYGAFTTFICLFWSLTCCCGLMQCQKAARFLNAFFPINNSLIICLKQHKEKKNCVMFSTCKEKIDFY